MTQDEQIRHLVATAESLCAAVAHEQARSTRLQRRFRWLAAAVAVLVGLGGSAGWLAGRQALAVGSGTVANDLQMAGQDMQALLAGTAPIIRFMADPQVQDDFRAILAVTGDMARKAKDDKNEIGAFVKNVGTLTERLRQDSDVMRIELAQMMQKKGRNVTPDQASPSFALFEAYDGIRSEMNFLNYNMLVMSQSMGSTLGRVGSWMP